MVGAISGAWPEYLATFAAESLLDMATHRIKGCLHCGKMTFLSPEDLYARDLLTEHELRSLELSKIPVSITQRCMKTRRSYLPARRSAFLN